MSMNYSKDRNTGVCVCVCVCGWVFVFVVVREWWGGVVDEQAHARICVSQIEQEVPI